MPNTGKPSKDCHTCRKRRVKCTLERPECQRCLRIGTRCPGYRDQQALMFRNEDISSLGGASATRDRRRARSSTSSDRESPSTPPQVSVPCDWSIRGIKLRDLDPIILNSRTSPSTCPIALSQWSHYALPLVLALFSFEVDGQRSFNQVQILATSVMKCPDYSPLIMCCEALGIAFLANRFRSTDAERMRDQAYVRALSATNVLVGDPDLCQQHEAPVSVWLLSLYEVMAGSQHHTEGSSTVTWGIHAQGSLELLRLRGPHQLDTPEGRSIFYMLSSSMHIRTLITGEDSPAFIQDWLLAARDKFTGPALDFYHMSSFAYDTAVVSSQARDALRTGDQNLLSWTTNDLWTRLAGLQTTFDQAMLDHPAREPVNPENLHMANQYRTFYMRCLQHVLGLVESADLRDMDGLLPEKNARISLSIRNMLHGLVDGILSSCSIILSTLMADDPTRRPSLPRIFARCIRPLYFCDVLKLLWPLRVTSSRKQLLTADQLTTSESMLRCMSEDFCIRQSVAVYHPVDIAWMTT